jgi:hypothetical protein
MKVYKVTLMHIDFDNMGLERVKVGIENARMGNLVQPGTVMSIEEADIGEWDDEHPLNQHKTQVAAFQNLFEKKA